MKVLADSNVFIDFWKKPTQELIDVFSNENVVICGVVRSELLQGAKSDADLSRINDMLDEFEELNIGDADWSAFGETLYRLRSNGITVPFQDALIAYISIKYNVQLWTNDKHFQFAQKVLNKLKLFSITDSTETL